MKALELLQRNLINMAIANPMKPKSCGNCKHGTAYMGTDRKWCEASIKQD